MALLQNKSHIVPSAVIDLTFEDDVHKVFTIHVKDIVRIKYNKNGLATTVEGKVTTISAGTTSYTYTADGIATYHTMCQTNKNGPYLVIDASTSYGSNTVTIYLYDILDADMIYAWKENFTVLTVPTDTEHGITAVHGLRLLNGVLQYTIDNGITWEDVVKESSSNDTEDSNTVADDSDNNGEPS